MSLNTTLTIMPKILPIEREIILWIDGLFSQKIKNLITNKEIINYP